MWERPSASLEQGSCVPGKVPQALLQSKQQKNLQAGLLQVENAHFICTTFVGPLLNEGIWGQILLLFRHLRLQNLAFWEEVPILREISFFGGKNWTPICNRISTTPPLTKVFALYTRVGVMKGLLTWKDLSFNKADHASNCWEGNCRLTKSCFYIWIWFCDMQFCCRFLGQINNYNIYISMVSQFSVIFKFLPRQQKNKNIRTSFLFK
jgi:hypothetical protein